MKLKSHIALASTRDVVSRLCRVRNAEYQSSNRGQTRFQQSQVLFLLLGVKKMAETCDSTEAVDSGSIPKWWQMIWLIFMLSTIIVMAVVLKTYLLTKFLISFYRLETLDKSSSPETLLSWLNNRITLLSLEFIKIAPSNNS